MVAHKPRPAGPDPQLYAALEALPEHLTGEIVDGHLIVSPRPGGPHAHAIGRLYSHLDRELGEGGGGPGGWWILFEPELHLGAQVVDPDLAGWPRERMPQGPVAAHFTLAPDWVAEGISGSGAYDRAKLPVYAQHGVKHVWLVDAATHSLEVLRNVRGAYQVAASFHGRVKVRAEPFEAVELDLSRLWLPGSKPKRRKGKS